jgi:hypothetical protein
VMRDSAVTWVCLRRRFKLSGGFRMPKQSLFRLIKRWKRYQSRGELKQVPRRTRGLYILYRNRNADDYEVVYRCRRLRSRGQRRHTRSPRAPFSFSTPFRWRKEHLKGNARLRGTVQKDGGPAPRRPSPVIRMSLARALPGEPTALGQRTS